MTALIMIGKGLFLALVTLAAFAALAAALGFEPASAEQVAKCGAKPAPACLFTIL